MVRKFSKDDIIFSLRERSKYYGLLADSYLAHVDDLVGSEREEMIELSQLSYVKSNLYSEAAFAFETGDVKLCTKKI